jgi:cellobiose phosphorylase
MRNAAAQHEGAAPALSIKIRLAHISNYFGLQLMRVKLSHFPPGMITLIPASRWLFENYHRLYLNLKAFQAKGGAASFRGLPVVRSGPNKGYPRVYLIAREIILGSNMHLNEESVIDLINEYQSVQILTTAELSMLPDALSFCLLDKIIEESKRIIPAIKNKVRANDLINKIAPLLIKNDMQALSLLKTKISKRDVRNHTFTSHLIYRLKGLSVNRTDIASFLAELSGVGKAAGPGLLMEITERERLFESETESTISALIDSLEEVSDIEIDRYFSKVSVLEAMLGEDPAGVYLKMDGPTRARYRRAAIRVAARHKVGEREVAKAALMLCATQAGNEAITNATHVGAYLLGDGKPYLREILSGKPVAHKGIRDIFRILRRASYFAFIFMLTIGIIPLVMWIAGIGILDFSPGRIIFMLCMLIPSSGISVFLVNSIFTRLIEPKVTMAMDFEKEIPDSCRTFIVMPVILSNSAGARSTVATLERHYLANRKNNLFFALLVDFSDSKTQVAPKDEEILLAAQEEITALNRRYTSKMPLFSLFYREREWNPVQQCWMGWERKRGKLEGFNALLVGEPDSRYHIPVGDPTMFSTIKYVITLDADTELPQESASKLIGVIEHPLNQPVLDPIQSRVRSGYVIVQSEIGNRIPAPSAGLFQVMMSGQAGFDPYASIVSDVYQDTFNEGIYAGKGIYHLRAFHRLLNRQIPENKVLSHDLLEGSMTRCAFASGIKLVDKVPTCIEAYLKREHRWIRGDWQLLPYLKNTSKINLLSKWKILDNLRRSLMHPAQLILILCNIFLVPEAPWIWLLFLFFELAVNLLNTLIGPVIAKMRHFFVRIAYWILLQNLFDITVQAFYRFILMPVRAYFSLDAIVRTLYRLFVSRKKLLEWQTAESVEKNASHTLGSYFRLMWQNYVPAAALIYGIMLPTGLFVKMIFAVLLSIFVLSPIIAALSEKQIPREIKRFSSKEQISQIRRLAVRIWRYFIDYSDKEHNWLCPDHIQEIPGPKTANRTSPTNIGLQLLAALSARDLGYLGLIDFVDSCERVLGVVRKMPLWNGHLYNWYDTETLHVIEPLYVSTVDSGNFLAHLLTLKAGLKSLTKQPVFGKSMLQGFADLLEADEDGEESLAELENIGKQKTGKIAIPGSDTDNMIAYLRTCEKDGSSQTEQINVLFLCIDALLPDLNTGKGTADFCAGLQKDRDLLASGQLPNLLKTPAELAAEGSTSSVLLINRIEKMVSDISRMVKAADFKPLFDNRKKLFHIGYHVSMQKPDRGHYDLLASEARLSSFLAIAKGDVPKRHWLSLGRPMTLVCGTPAFVSWSGSMFEYLMPNLVMRVPPGSVMDHSCRAAVTSQIKYGKKMHFPWGISESQYYIFDNNANYQYGPFGVGRMRLQPSLKPTKVIAPYATLLALGTSPRKALKNVEALYNSGAGGKYGLHEALDFNRPDTVTMKSFLVVRSYMTHHLGMSLSAINNLINGNILQARFHSEPMIRANEILLEETFASPMVTIASIGYSIDVESRELELEEIETRICSTINTPFPYAHILSNGHYQLMMTSKGDGFSACDHVMINRWKPDQQNGGSGSFIYIRETGTSKLWSSTYFPVMIRPDSYKAIFSHDKVEYERKDGLITTHTEITLSPVDQLEIRKVTLANHGQRTVNLELTSYMEPVIDEWMADVSHPAYSKLFVETSYMSDRKLLVAGRRPKSPQEKSSYIMHLIRTDAVSVQPVRFETSRQDFIGRSGSLSSPDALKPGYNLMQKGGTATDPILSLQVTVSVPPGRSTVVSFITGFCTSMSEVMSLCDKLTARLSVEDIFKIARTSSLLEIEYLKISSVQLTAIQNLVGAIYYPTNVFKDADDVICKNRLGQSALWRFGISGDNPVLLLRISDVKEADTLRDVLLAYEFLRLQKIRTDLVILNEAEGGYDDGLQQMIFEQTVTVRVYEHRLSRLGIFVLRACQISEDEKNLLLTVARVIFTPQTGIYFRKVTMPWSEEKVSEVIRLPSGVQTEEVVSRDTGHHGDPVPEFFNGIGGFVQDGSEYEIRLKEGIRTPVPWINVIANERFGFLISEIGAGYTWNGNSRENKLTTWYNDPVLTPVSEAVYVRNRATGTIISPFALVPGAEGSFRIRHGFGYSVFARRDNEIGLSMTVFAAKEESVKLMILEIENNSAQAVDLSVSFYAEWVLGTFRELTERYIVTDFDANAEILTARNAYSGQDLERLAFQFVSEPITAFTGDRKSFIGEQGSVRYPEGLTNAGLTGDVGAGFDPCGVINCDLRVNSGKARTIVFGLGQADDKGKAAEMAARFRAVSYAKSELEAVRCFWKKLPGDITIRTPDRAMDILINGWMTYQVITCRLRARAAFYQCGGAYGFRDQLQDVLAVMDFDSQLTRKQILLCASRQFTAGDVQHWWHPGGVGVRTRISDDLLWLPYVTAEYIRYTGDAAILDEQVHFLEEKPLEKNQHEVVSNPMATEQTADLYTHCILAIDHACRMGPHGIPLIKGGDWNDGMNLVGQKEQGESVWLGWFLSTVLKQFIPICKARADVERSEKYKRIIKEIIGNIESHAWDGQWYLRAFFDNGESIGSSQNEECRIDSISQSWAVLSKGADKMRANMALRSADRMLVNNEEGIVLLLTPPFGRSKNQPGYISGYNPGIRENGGQYTHAAVWLAMAFCEIGDGEEAYRLLNMLNPIQATADFRLVNRYEKEPYVMTADVSAGYPNSGKGGWSWYTGAAGWVYRAVIGNFLGFKREGQYLSITPCVSSAFGRYQIEYRYGSALYEITVLRSPDLVSGVISMYLDGEMKKSNRLKMIDDGTVHHVEVRFGNRQINGNSI